MELERRVEQISATIRELRQTAGDGRKTRQLLDSLFRTVHSFKAAASTEGLTDLSRIAHEFENLLHSLRTGQLTFDDRVQQVFDETATALRDGSHATSLTRLNELANPAPEGRKLPTEFANLRDDERHRAMAALHEGANLYAMETVFETDDFDERFRQLKERLEETAELISTSATMADDKVIFHVVYASRSEKIPAQTLFRQAVRAGTSLAEKLAKHVNFVVQGDEVLLDKPVSDALFDVLLHLVRNAVDHGIDSRGTVTLQATTTGDHLQIVVKDNGRGIDAANLPLIFRPGFSTATEITELSGRGVGLDAVKVAVEELGGSVSVTSEPGKGSSFEITIPNQITLRTPSSDA